jgi:tRNA nucleotidyltransferase/poly(A) polymerase
MSKIEVIAEQTAFLLEKQKALLDMFKKGFGSLYGELEIAQKKAEQVKAGSDLISFQNVFALLAEYEKELVDNLEEDMKFVEEQHTAVTKIAEIKDEKVAEELIELMLEDGYEVEDSNAFKIEIEEEVEGAKEEFAEMHADILEVLNSSGIKELEEMLRAYKESRKVEEECEDDEDECCGGSCHSCPGCNVFDGLEIEEEKKKK